ncbi:Carboxyvinyl-carboxyphosphonate phosphorylmutase [Phytophthora cinnamomi]|uniref:Carboxyvinyl-carboxyphosphonate phosphorylmutase n=1 Tax=Phytophthora cinnamomi TaxID=4785 RepID=UPI00355987FC|nr:Carboxyvinyl-carboxyphosphonate phosphorylmutase [Phytophthora cinnamomi]KAG6608714.1 Carboxyvinyl-carboxyphosphonate phosphorylmutase [Phytophthora cinnamomi]
MELGVAELALALLGATLLALLALWLYRMVQYRKAVRRSQARWLDYEPAPVLTEDELGLNWPSLKPILLSPIPEERLESGRESENDSMLSVRRDSMRLSAISVIAYGSFDQPVAKTAKV